MADRSFRFFTSIHRALYRGSGGRLGKRMAGVPVLLLTTTGRKTGNERTTPLMYFKHDDDDLLVVASKGGSPRHPEWYLNLVANPEVTVQIGSEKRRMRAFTATESERSAFWPEVVKAFKGYGEYQRKTTREIPVVILKSAYRADSQPSKALNAQKS